MITVKIVKEYELNVISTDVLTRPKREECASHTELRSRDAVTLGVPIKP